MEDDKKLCRHLTEDIITVAITKPDGTVSHKDVKLGDSMLKMRELLDETETKVMNLVAELTEVDEELMSSLREFNEVTKAEGDVLRKKISNLQADAEAYYKQTLENVSKARKEDQALNIEANRKLQAFMASLF